ncbi:sulfatase-like hydrolase/transferase [bacterium]|nr:sulfatase-like hydrolase/transferase [bacterium]
MKSRLQFLGLFILFKFSILAWGKELSNVVIILADDLGYGDCESFNPASKISTPNLNQLANEGIRFTDAHAASGTCTPSRYGLLTGINPARTGVLNTLLARGKAIITKEEKTLGDLFRSEGYHTHMVGKWHLGFNYPNQKKNKWTDQPLPGGPVDRGFDTFFGIPSSAGSDPMCWIENNRFTKEPTKPFTFPKFNIKGESITVKTKTAPGFSVEQASPTLVKRAVKIIEDHAQDKSDRPFFLYYASPIPHQPWAPMKKFAGKSGFGPYGDFLMQMDWVVGEIHQTLKKKRARPKHPAHFHQRQRRWSGGSQTNESTGACLLGKISRHESSSLRGWTPGALYREVARQTGRRDHLRIHHQFHRFLRHLCRFVKSQFGERISHCSGQPEFFNRFAETGKTILPSTDGSPIECLAGG